MTVTAKREPATAEFWAIRNEYGFYVGTWQKRHEAIGFHLKALGKTWAYCRAKGDDAVEVLVTEIIPGKPAKPVTIKRKRAKPGQRGVLEYRRKYAKA